VCQDKYPYNAHSIVLEILRAAKIIEGMKGAHAREKGAIGLEGEMVDAPMLKQV
jgi:citrate lyase beta subunit